MRPSPLFHTVVIAGVGLIGGSVGLGVRQRFLAERVIGVDRDPAVLEAALGLGAIDEIRLHAGDWLGDADLVVLAPPAREIVPLAESLLPYLGQETILSDVGSVKAEITKRLAGARFVGGHPMAGSEKVGVQYASAALLENAVWVLTPTPATDRGALEAVRRFVNELGAKAIEVAPEQHDRLVAAVSHLPYLAAVALTQVVAEDSDRELMMLLAAGGFRDLTRVASGNPRMSRDMVAGNIAAIREAVGAFRRRVEALERLLGDPEALLAQAEQAKRDRDAIPIVRRSLLPARFEVVIAVPDKPGELAKITKALGDAGVNVKDIEVLAIREAGGALRLAFESGSELQRATSALTQAGYEARGRG